VLAAADQTGAEERVEPIATAPGYPKVCVVDARGFDRMVSAKLGRRSVDTGHTFAVT
jgi:hypothetical protein